MAKILMTLESEFQHDERIEKEAKALLEDHHEVHILCYTRTNQPLFEEWQNITIHRFQLSKWTYKSSALSLQFPFYFNKWKNELNKVLKAGNYDIVHIHDLPLVSVVEKLKPKFNYKTILDLHENWPALMYLSPFSKKFPVSIFFSFSKWKQYEKKWVNKVDKLITVIEEAKERIIALGVNKDNIQVISNTIDLQTLKLPEKQENYEAFTLLYSGGVNEHRGLHIVLQALKKLKESGITINLIIVGKGNYLENLKTMAKELQIEKQFITLGWKSYQEMMNYIVSAHALIIPHLRSEHTDATIPNKLFQYMYAQKPFLAADCTPIKRIVDAEKAGLVYENNNANDLAEKLQLIYQDYDNHLKLAEKNKKIVEERYHWGVQAEKIRAFYKKVI